MPPRPSTFAYPKNAIISRLNLAMPRRHRIPGLPHHFCFSSHSGMTMSLSIIWSETPRFLARLRIAEKVWPWYEISKLRRFKAWQPELLSAASSSVAFQKGSRFSRRIRRDEYNRSRSRALPAILTWPCQWLASVLRFSGPSDPGLSDLRFLPEIFIWNLDVIKRIRFASTTDEVTHDDGDMLIDWMMAIRTIDWIHAQSKNPSGYSSVKVTRIWPQSRHHSLSESPIRRSCGQSVNREDPRDDVSRVQSSTCGNGHTNRRTPRIQGCGGWICSVWAPLLASGAPRFRAHPFFTFRAFHDSHSNRLQWKQRGPGKISVL